MPSEIMFTVSELNGMVKELLDACPPFRQLLVQGEISNYKRHSSGHHYFSLKDEQASIPAVLFRYEAMRLRFRPENGMKVVARGRVSSFPRTGQVQLYVSELLPDGVGALQVAFDQLKARLQKEGLFDEKRKKPLPAMPRKIALVTSPTGAVVRDMVRILRRRFPLTQVVLYPVAVQGPGAAAQIAEGILYLNNYRLADVIIVGRGGGSMEDLWAFNEEMVARAIAVSELPVISAVGHEPDVTISDLVADVRAATPSHAAELAVPDQMEIRAALDQRRARLLRDMQRMLQQHKTELAAKSQRLERQSPVRVVQEKRMLLEHLSQRLSVSARGATQERRRQLERSWERMRAAAEKRTQAGGQRLALAAAQLDALSPFRVLGRGYAMAFNQRGEVVRQAAQLQQDEKLTVRFAKGEAVCRVIETGGERDAAQKEREL